ncbi:ATPase associated with various cellular activities AAA_3 [Halorhabdus utahensis DSM 12940]|uniref:ATPase associated with various cellular activities AAA_3 n=1 Tax=Halorhabdus utahensis (strain DSM 12940 / JCM 11049 / AX-2) TaxID=519442 RepID=C7NN03_HALUD|nr:MoxR family ATPase [Halorhabdus utahensis]ACV12701.1 ATPase associated with various cellular activities AAA_3 [Halorhabdus utahensis DSM 12940]
MTDIESTPTETQRDLDVDDVGGIADDVIENVERVIVGHPDAIEHILTALFARGHVLLEDVPGVGKTMLSRAIAASFDCSFKRVQFTPDLLPSDVTGANVYNQKTQTFEFRSGPIFANVVLGDEINRAPPKTQSALLEAMEEGQVTIDGETHSVPDPFAVIATQNTVERDRTYDLPMAELDRFMKKLELGYPTAGDESEMLENVVGTHPIEAVEPVASLADLEDIRAVTADVTVEEPVRTYVTRLARFTRNHAELGASPRASVLLLRAAQGRAVLNGRDYVVPDDVQTEATVVLPHRIRSGAAERTAADLVADALENVPVE